MGLQVIDLLTAYGLHKVILFFTCLGAGGGGVGGGGGGFTKIVLVVIWVCLWATGVFGSVAASGKRRKI